jgi:hypothetical protein
MRCFHMPVIGTVFAILCATSAGAQAPMPDSTRVGTLPTVTVTADAPGGNWLTRAWDRRQAVVSLMEENRRLAGVLRREDARVARLEKHLDSLKRVDAERRAALATIQDSVTAVRARRLALEARLIAMEPRRDR